MFISKFVGNLYMSPYSCTQNVSTIYKKDNCKGLCEEDLVMAIIWKSFYFNIPDNFFFEISEVQRSTNKTQSILKKNVDK
jgi:hypothetical protein